MLDGQMKRYLAHHAVSGHGAHDPTLLNASKDRTSTPDSWTVLLGLPYCHQWLSLSNGLGGGGGEGGGCGGDGGGCGGGGGFGWLQKEQLEQLQ